MKRQLHRRFLPPLITLAFLLGLLLVPRSATSMWQLILAAGAFLIALVLDWRRLMPHTKILCAAIMALLFVIRGLVDRQIMLPAWCWELMFAIAIVGGLSFLYDTHVRVRL